MPQGTIQSVDRVFEIIEVLAKSQNLCSFRDSEGFSSTRQPFTECCYLISVVTQSIIRDRKI